MTKIEADNIISNYYPNYLTNDELVTAARYKQTKEFENLERVCKKAESLLPTWNIVIEEIKNDLPNTYNVQDWSHLFRYEPCLRLRISYPKHNQIPKRQRELMLNVSILIEYYSIYISENDFNPTEKKYTLPVLAIKNSHNDEYLRIKPLAGSIEERVSEHFGPMTTKEFKYEDVEKEKQVFAIIESTLTKHFPNHKKFNFTFILDRADNFTNATSLGGEMTYFNCLFSDHLF